MTVKELIAKLKTYDENWQVEVAYFDGYNKAYEIVHNTGIVTDELMVGTNEKIDRTVLIGASNIRNVLDKA